MYKQEIERTRFQTQALTIETFLEGLNLEVKTLGAGGSAAFSRRPAHSADQSV